MAVGIAVLATVGIPGLARASSISFAQFSEASPGGNLFAYLDNGSGNDAQFGTSTGGPLGAAIPVSFTYLTVAGPMPLDLQGNQNATLSMTSSTKTISTVLGGVVGSQPITGAGTVTDTISIIRSTPANEGSGSRTNLLTVTFTGQMIGVMEGRTPQVSADTLLSGNSVTYSSDFLTFSPSAERDFSLTFSSWTNTGNGNGLEQAADLFFAGALASGTGTFDGAATVPEPAAMTLGAIAAVMLVLSARHLTGQRKALAKCRVKAK
ncbi:MAG TPA: hypothetical protein VMJ32_10140 [Pirellulales bacterium]|nr:hypothetical protein [Pirellulales bacterium]